MVNKCMNKRVSIDLKGIVIAAAWGPTGEVSAVDIAGYDEKRYRIADDPIGRKLFQYVKKAVAVRGKLASEHQQNIVYVEEIWYDGTEPISADADR